MAEIRTAYQSNTAVEKDKTRQHLSVYPADIKLVHGWKREQQRRLGRCLISDQQTLRLHPYTGSDILCTRAFGAHTQPTVWARRHGVAASSGATATVSKLHPRIPLQPVRFCGPRCLACQTYRVGLAARPRRDGTCSDAGVRHRRNAPSKRNSSPDKRRQRWLPVCLPTLM